MNCEQTKKQNINWVIRVLNTEESNFWEQRNSGFSENDINLEIVEKRSVFSGKRAFREEDQLNDAENQRR